MRICLLTLGFLISSGVYAQYTETSPFFFNTLSISNPAYSGLESRRLISTQYLETGFSDEWGFQAVADIKSEKLSSGLGLNFDNFDGTNVRSNTLKLNYNFQLNFGEDHRLSLGISGALDYMFVYTNSFLFDTRQSIDRYSFGIIYDPNIYRAAEARSFYSFRPGIGAVYKCNRFLTGISLTSHLRPLLGTYKSDTNVVQSYWGKGYMNRFHAFLSYNFRLSDRLQWKHILSGQAGLNAQGIVYGYYNMEFCISNVLTIGWQLAGKSTNFTQAWAYLGIEIKKRFQINYSMGTTVSEFTNQSESSQNLNLAYILR